MKGPDLLGGHKHRPYVCLSTEEPPFRDEEAVYAVVTTTGRSTAIPLATADFESGGLPRESYVVGSRNDQTRGYCRDRRSISGRHS